jgi:hypothetical protein
MVQHMKALERANEVRLWRAEQHRQVKAGNFQLASDLLVERDPRLLSLGIGEFLEWLPRVGTAVSDKIIKQVFPYAVSTTRSRRIETLDLETCLRIAAVIRERGEGREERVAA